VRIAFITDSDRVGESGVGDYTLLLSEALRAQGVEAGVFTLAEFQGSDSQRAISRMTGFAPDWVSFQFVPYAYAFRGLVNASTLPWRRLRGKRGTHMMFHEIWIGAHQGARWRDRIIGALQRRGIRSVVKVLRPEAVHCSNQLYGSMLSAAGISNRILPLFGNIRLAWGGADPYAEQVARLDPGSKRKDWTVAVLFGSLYPNTGARGLLQWMSETARRHGRRLLVASVGRCTDAASHFAAWKQPLDESREVSFHVQGPMPVEQISNWLQHADCGISTTPYNIIEKSGSAAALVEHGLPVLVCDEGAPIRCLANVRPDLAPRFWLGKEPRLAELRDLPAKRRPYDGLAEVAKSFLQQLSEPQADG